MSSVPLSWKVSVSEASRRTGIAWARWISFSVIAILGTSIDLLTKQWVFSWRGLPGVQPPWWIVEGYVGIETAVNPGALFGMGAGFGTLFAALSVVAAIAVLVWLGKFGAIDSWWLTICLAMVMGGIFGNLYDRLGMWNPPASEPAWASGVRDWILLQYSSYKWPNFNIADSLLVCGAIMLGIHSFFMVPVSDEASEADGQQNSSSQKS